jgi:integrase
MARAAEHIPVDKVRVIQRMLRGAGNLRDTLLWTAGPNWALRASDLLSVKLRDVRGPRGIRDSFTVKQRKTSKAVTCHNTKKVKVAIREYLEQQHPAPGDKDAPLFPSARKAADGSLKPLSRVQLWNVIRRDVGALDLRHGSYSPHSWRKTWGRAALDGGVQMAVIQTKLGHATPGSLLTYLGITRDDVRKASEKIEI